MDDIIVRVARVLACMTRLRILSLLARSRELPPTELADHLRVRVDTVCAHLSKLSAAGLLLRRRSGAWCYCQAGSPYSETALSGKVSAWLRELLSKPGRAIDNPEVGQLRDYLSPDLETAVHELVFEAATAFANHRRLQILRWLVTRGPATTAVLCKELSMSESALSRQLTKLTKRGYVTSSAVRRGATYQLAAEPKTPVHGRLLEIVRAEWETG